MRNHILFVAGALSVTGCNKSPQVHEKNASVEQVANAVQKSGVADDIYLRAGEWRVINTLEEMNIPDLPASAQTEMKQAMGKRGNATYQYCLTPEQAKKPGGKFFSRQADRNCRYDHFNMGGGKVDAVLRCASPSGSMSMSIQGNYQADSYSTHVSMNMEGSNNGDMTMKMRSEAHRIGECTPVDQAEAERESGTKG